MASLTKQELKHFYRIGVLAGFKCKGSETPTNLSTDGWFDSAYAKWQEEVKDGTYGKRGRIFQRALQKTWKEAGSPREGIEFEGKHYSFEELAPLVLAMEQAEE
jgi:hypothetical protein